MYIDGIVRRLLGKLAEGQQIVNLDFNSFRSLGFLLLSGMFLSRISFNPLSYLASSYTQLERPPRTLRELQAAT